MDNPCVLEIDDPSNNEYKCIEICFYSFGNCCIQSACSCTIIAIFIYCIYMGATGNISK